MAKVPWSVDLVDAPDGYRVRTMLAGREVDCTPTIPERHVAEQVQEILADLMRGREVKQMLNDAIRSRSQDPQP